MRKLNLNVYKPAVCLLVILFFISYAETFSQVKIKERVEIEPDGVQQINSYDWCNCSFCDEHQIRLKFTPAKIIPGQTAILKLWDGGTDYEYEYNEDGFQIIETNINIEPNIGKLTKIGSGEYLFSVNQNIQADTAIAVTVTYENYNQACVSLSKSLINLLNNEDHVSMSCPSCGENSAPGLFRHFGCGQIFVGNKETLQISTFTEALENGEPAQLLIQKRLPDGTLEGFPPGQKFEVSISEGCELGSIWAPVSQYAWQNGTHLTGVMEPIIFAPNFPIDTNNVIRIKVGEIDNSCEGSFEPAPYFDPGSFLSLVKEHVKRGNSLNKKSADGEECFIGELAAANTGTLELPINYEIEIISPAIGQIEWITEEPKMPEVICKAKLNKYVGEVIFNWEYEISYEYTRRHISGTSICSRKSKTTISGSKTEFSLGDITTEWLVPFKKENASFEFISSNFRDGCQNTISEWIGGDDIFTGGDIKVTVTANSTEGRFIARKEFAGNELKLLGKNPPDVNTIYLYANSREIEAILRHEAKAAHFTGDEIPSKFWRPYYAKGYPVYGPPNGYGLMQLDNPAATEMQLWNWKENLNGGKRLYFDEKKPLSVSWLNKHKDWLDARPNLKEEYILKCAFQKYNGGIDKETRKPIYYWVWDNHRGWIKDKRIENDYGGKVYNIYKSLN